MSDPLAILFEDNHCLAVAKPAPLLTQGPPGVPSLEAQVKAYLKTKYQKAGGVYLGVPHRLDRPVSGVVVFARNSKAARRLAEQFQSREVRKVYWALVEGISAPAEGVCDDWLLKIQNEARAEVVAEGTPGARHARLRFRRLSETSEGTLLEVEPETGRSHQIRVQLASRGWPIRGDALYGAVQPFGPPADVPRARVIALHARSLTFLHPLSYEPMTLSAEPPAWWPPIGASGAASP